MTRETLAATPLTDACPTERGVFKVEELAACSRRLERDRADLIAALENVYRFCPVQIQDELQATLAQVRS